jgi:serine/threonine-protein kinase ATR
MDYKLTHDQLYRLAEFKGIPPLRLLAPFWRNIGIVVVKDFNLRPQTTQLLSDLLGMTVDGFLVHTQSFTLPYLVLLKKKDLVMRIVRARGHDRSARDILMESDNLSAILALLLMQESFDGDALVALFKHASDALDLKLEDLVDTEPTTTAYELLKVSADLEDSRKVSCMCGQQWWGSPC